MEKEKQKKLIKKIESMPSGKLKESLKQGIKQKQQKEVLK